MPVDASDELIEPVACGASDVAFKQFVGISPVWQAHSGQPQVHARLSTMVRPAYATGAIEADFSRELVEKHNGIARMQKTETNKRLEIGRAHV